MWVSGEEESCWGVSLGWRWGSEETHEAGAGELGRQGRGSEGWQLPRVSWETCSVPLSHGGCRSRRARI